MVYSVVFVADAQRKILFSVPHLKKRSKHYWIA